ncbi:MAG TPA: FHA domain-containing protein, partial [Pyrinomonadaceae bacterium]|nr:FHA domain-containing protein [Pyrinomonadaceae bacterium]
MVEVILTIYSLEDTREVPLSGSRLSIGRSDIADLPINDEGLSRVHATIYREENRVWVLDKGSTNGTYVNNTPVPPAGLPIANGDEITVGNDTAIRVRIVEVVTASTQAGSTLSGSRVFSWPLITAAGGVAIVLVVAVVIASLVNKKETGTETILRTSPSLSEPQVK